MLQNQLLKLTGLFLFLVGAQNLNAQRVSFEKDNEHPYLTQWRAHELFEDADPCYYGIKRMEVKDDSWRDIKFTTHSDDGYKNIYYNNIFCKNEGAIPIIVRVSYVVKKTKRKLFGGSDYPLTGEVISLSPMSASYVIPPDGRSYGIIPHSEAIQCVGKNDQTRGFEVRKIYCSWVDSY